MPDRAFLDANISIFAAGAPHPLREPCRRVLVEAARHPGAVYSSAEVLQEILHVYARRGLPSRGAGIIYQLRDLLGDHVAPMTAEDVYWCLSANLHSSLQTRDRIHLAVMARLNITNIISADRAFDGVAGITRLDPARLDEWSTTVFGS